MDGAGSRFLLQYFLKGTGFDLKQCYMKKLLFILPLCIGLIQCKDGEKTSSEKITPRNLSIHKSNAYNDFFLDSTDVTDFIEKNQLPDDTARRIISFYSARNYEFAWFSSAGLSEQAMGFASLINLSGDTSRDIGKLQTRLNNYLGSDQPIGKPSKSVIRDEILLTQNFIEYAIKHFDSGYVKQDEIENFVPFAKVDPMSEADSLLKKRNKDKKYFIQINEPYKLLMAELARYTSLADGKEWQKVDPKEKFEKGKSSIGVRALKINLYLAGDLPRLDSSLVFDDSLEAGIRHFQKRIGQTPTGKPGAAFFTIINTPPAKMVEKILINMNRMRWQPINTPGRLLKVNIPGFTLHVYSDGNEAFQMPVIVGKEGHSTVLFADKLTTIVFSPYWNVPDNIVKNEIVPAMDKNPDYLEENNMEITGQRDGLPVIRQKPGPKNSLGKVKFLFPNSFNIYFHDTPAKSLFSRDERAYSHGCIRLSEPERLAEWLLQDDKKWTSSKIKDAMNSGNNQFVELKHPASVIITYYTAWVDDNGLNLRDDLYGHDADVISKWFKKP